MLRNGGGFIWSVATVCSYGSGNYVIKDMGGRIDDAFGVSGPIYYQWQLPVWYPILHYRNLLVKLQMKMLKKHKYKKANIGNWVSIGLTASLLLLVQYMLPANMKMEFFEKERHFVDESFLCYDCWTCSWCCYFICYRILHRIGNKTSYGYSSKIKYWSRD
jgi:hypothetical protein